MKKKLASFRFVRAAWTFVVYLYSDLSRGRFRGVLLIGLGNLLPDFLCCTIIRSVLWKLSGVELGDYSSTAIRAGVFTEYPSNLVIGKNFMINRNSYLDTNDQITIGDYVTISINCSILTISHLGLQHEIDVSAPVIIKDHCLIYANCTILPGAILEEGVVLAAGSVLKGPTQPWSIYAGIPAKFVKAREQIESK
jgi:acetyltransferase-like isoleucine patch superfamily enzyme